MPILWLPRHGSAQSPKPSREMAPIQFEFYQRVSRKVTAAVTILELSDEKFVAPRSPRASRIALLSEGRSCTASFFASLQPNVSHP